jgi:predicted amidohydrolase
VLPAAKLNVGAPADIAILELREGTFEFLDNYKGTRTGKQRLFPVATVLAGKRAGGVGKFVECARVPTRGHGVVASLLRLSPPYKDDRILTNC